MQSLKLRVQVLCAVGLASVAAVACDQALAPRYQHPNDGSGGSAVGDSNPGGSGTGTVPSGGSDPGASSGAGGSVASDGTAGASGSAGASAAGNGGTSNTSSGSGGGGGSGGSPAVDMCAHIGPRTRTDLTPTNGRVECATNDFGVEGDWKINSADPALITSGFTGSMVCANGTIAQVVATPTSGGQPDFGRYWGGGLAFVMHNGGAGFLAEAYDATANGLTGISVKLSGATIPAEMRFKFKMIGINDSYCSEVKNPTSGQAIMLHTGDAIHNCWAPDSASTLDVTMIENYEVQVVSQTSMAVPFDICLTEIKALTD
jgi:hypothetical protein